SSCSDAQKSDGFTSLHVGAPPQNSNLSALVDDLIELKRTLSLVWRAQMSALGQSRRFDPLPVTSGLPRTTDINRPAPLVRFVPTAEVTALFDHFVGAGKKGRRNSQAKSFRSLEIDHEFVPGRCLHRQVRWLLTFED